MGCSESSPKRKIIIGISQETRKYQINNLTLHLRKLEKEQHTTLKVIRRKQIIKIRAEINEVKM